MQFEGVMPAITTPFAPDGAVDHAFLGRHARWLVDHESSAIIALGSLGEGATLAFAEKAAVLSTLVGAVDGRVPVVCAISALSTADAVELARRAAELGCRGLMVLPPYVHKGPWSEIRDHFSAVITATALPCMLYNNPIAYGNDLLPERVAELASAHENVVALKESSGDVRRVTAVRALVGDRLRLLAGLDDMVVEAVAASADGWVAGLVNALPAESVALYEYAKRGDTERAAALYRWFLPLLRLDTVPEFVQLIKLVQARVDMGSERVRPPRQPVQGALREQTLALLAEHLAEGTRPTELSR